MLTTPRGATQQTRRRRHAHGFAVRSLGAAAFRCRDRERGSEEVAEADPGEELTADPISDVTDLLRSVVGRVDGDAEGSLTVRESHNARDLIGHERGVGVLWS